MCNNPYCPLQYDPSKEPCKSCRFNYEMKLPPGFDKIFKGK